MPLLRQELRSTVICARRLVILIINVINGQTVLWELKKNSNLVKFELGIYLDKASELRRKLKKKLAMIMGSFSVFVTYKHSKYDFGRTLGNGNTICLIPTLQWCLSQSIAPTIHGTAARARLTDITAAVD